MHIGKLFFFTNVLYWKFAVCSEFFKIYIEVCLEVETDYGPGIMLVKTTFLFCDSGVPALTYLDLKNLTIVLLKLLAAVFDNSFLTKIEQHWFTTEVAVL